MYLHSIPDNLSSQLFFSSWLIFYIPVLAYIIYTIYYIYDRYSFKQLMDYLHYGKELYISDLYLYLTFYTQYIIGATTVYLIYVAAIYLSYLVGIN